MSLSDIYILIISISPIAQFVMICFDSFWQTIDIHRRGTGHPEDIKKSVGHMIWGTAGGIYTFFAMLTLAKLYRDAEIKEGETEAIVLAIAIPLIEIAVSFLPLLASVIGFKQRPKSCIKQENNLIAQLLAVKNGDNLITYVSLLFAFIGEYFLYKQIQETSILWIMILTAFLLLFSFIKQCILKYRVGHGLYGTSYLEAKEIVTFILEWHKKNGDSNSKPPKLVFTQEEIDQCLQVNGGEEYAG